MSEISTWSATAADNDGSPPDFLAEGCAPSSVNDAFREMQASVRRWYIDAQWADWGHTPTRVDGDTFTVATDLTAVYQVGRRLKVDGSATGYCTIASSSYSAPNTTVNVTMDTGSLPATLSTIYVGVLSASNGSIPLHSASLLTSGSLPDARLSANVPLKNAANNFAETQTITKDGSLLLFSDGATLSAGFSNTATQLNIGTISDHPVTFFTNNTTRAILDAGLQIGSPTGGDKGAGALNTAGAIYQNNVAVALSTDELDADAITSGTLANARLPATINATDLQISSVPIFASGSFTATLTGCTTSPTGTATWYRAGNIVTLVLPVLTGTSNATTCTITGLPAGIQPATIASQSQRLAVCVDNGANVDAIATIEDASGTISLSKASFAAFTGSGTKGLSVESVLTYLIT